jgi:hypothetical protein
VLWRHTKYLSKILPVNTPTGYAEFSHTHTARQHHHDGAAAGV